MNTSLTTFDGFPRADIDVAQIRTTRARIIRLKNDHKALMSKLEDAVHEQFAAGKTEELPTNGTSSSAHLNDAGSSRAAAPVVEPPFAKVNAVVPGSPAEQAGMRAGDKVIKFGLANWTNHERLSKVAEVVQQNENVSDEARRRVLDYELTLLATDPGQSPPRDVRNLSSTSIRSSTHTTSELGRPWTAWVSSGAFMIPPTAMETCIQTIGSDVHRTAALVANC